jgi:hypothetical protein
MPVPVPIYEYPPETKEPLDWAELPTVDLSKIDTEEGKKEQAQILIDAVRQKGFFYVKVNLPYVFNERQADIFRNSRGTISLRTGSTDNSPSAKNSTTYLFQRRQSLPILTLTRGTITVTGLRGEGCRS